jgi:succinoglycan biosynthesis protein ExoA
MRFGLVMPFFNEGRHLEAVLASIAAQRLARERFYLVAVDDGSTDHGPALVRRFLDQGILEGSLVSAGARSIPAALNRGIEHVAAADAVVRLDAHTIYGPGYLEAIVEAFARLPDDVWCVGAAPRPRRHRAFGLRLHAALFENPMGLGPAPFRVSEASREVEHVYLGAWRPGVLQRLGGYDEGWSANEDCELSARLRRAGGRIVRIRLPGRLILTRGPAAAVRQWGRYGYWRGRTVRRHPEVANPRHLAPTLALAAGVALACSPLRAACLPLALAYAGAVVLGRRKHESAAVTAACLAFFPAVQAAYGIGFLAGVTRAAAPPFASRLAATAT